MMEHLELALMALWGVAGAGIAWYAASIAREVTYVTLADGRRQERSLPLSFKMLLPFVPNLNSLMSRPSFAKETAKADAMLVSGGYEGLLNGREFVALRILVPIVMGLVWCGAVFLGGAVMPDSLFVSMRTPLCAAGFALFALQPSLWLKDAVKKRHLSIMKALPFVLDVLTLSVEAGMDFISALQRNCASRKMDPLNEELLRMTKEIQVGSSRKAALKAMSDRVRQSDLKAVAYALIQADELGVSIGSILRIQSDQLRARRFDRAEKLANEAPTKMLGPLMLCIFPAVFIILLGPIVVQAMKGLL
ncbi:MAG: type II secretion system F family protein [Kiritimatiellae bacterium]|nr:type II secretion system F family protein [Kiritimatiellia bacterium]